jgi:hypothetical protein
MERYILIGGIVTGGILLFTILVEILSGLLRKRDQRGISHFRGDSAELPHLDSMMEASGERFTQERWNLPGFDPVYRAIAAPAPHELAERFTQGRSEGLFRFRQFRFYPEGYSVQLTDLGSLVRRYLERVRGMIDASEILFCVRTGELRIDPYLKLKGSLILSGALLEGDRLAPEIIDSLLLGENIISENERTLHLPLLTHAGLLGAVRVNASRPILLTDGFREFSEESSRFGEFLYQSLIFDQATKDPVTSFYNGICFQRDIELEFEMRHSWTSPRELILIRSGEGIESALQFLQPLIRAGFRPYRIAFDMAAFLGRFADHKRRQDTLDAISNRTPEMELRFGEAPLTADITSPQEWFRSAEEALIASTNLSEMSLSTFKKTKSDASHDGLAFE